MVAYTLILKDESIIEEREENALRWLKEHIGELEHNWRIHTTLSFETVMIVALPPKAERILVKWFAETEGQTAPYPMGTLLFWSRTSERISGHEGI